MKERKNNVNISDKVRNILNGSLCIRSVMSRGLINDRALAKYILKKRWVDASIHAVISAIRRYEPSRYDKIFENAQKIINKAAAISAKSPLTSITLIRDAETQKLLSQLFSTIPYNQGDVLRIIQANEFIKMLVDEKNLKKIKKLFPENKILRIDKNIAEINVHMHSDAENVPGVMAVIANRLAINGINVLETMSCSPEWLWFIEEKDLPKACNILYQLGRLNNSVFSDVSVE